MCPHSPCTFTTLLFRASNQVHRSKEWREVLFCNESKTHTHGAYYLHSTLPGQQNLYLSFPRYINVNANETTINQTTLPLKNHISMVLLGRENCCQIQKQTSPHHHQNNRVNLISNRKHSFFHCTSSMPAMLFTASFLRELWSFLSSAVAVLCTTFFFLRAVPWEESRDNSQLCSKPLNTNYKSQATVWATSFKLWDICVDKNASQLISLYLQLWPSFPFLSFFLSIKKPKKHQTRVYFPFY